MLPIGPHCGQIMQMTNFSRDISWSAAGSSIDNCLVIGLNSEIAPLKEIGEGAWHRGILPEALC